MENSNLPPSSSPYYAYMLRFWSEQQLGETTWRFTLLDPHSGRCKGFQSLNALFNHLASLTEEDGSPADLSSRSTDD